MHNAIFIFRLEPRHQQQSLTSECISDLSTSLSLSLHLLGFRKYLRSACLAMSDLSRSPLFAVMVVRQTMAFNLG